MDISEINYDSIDKEYKIEYLKSLLQNLSDQKKYNLLFISFSIAIAAFLVDRFTLNNELPEEFLQYKFLFIINIVVYLLSASLFTIWLANIHRLSIKLIDLFITLDLETARRIHYPKEEFYKKWGWINSLATTFLIGGILFTIIIVLVSNNLL